VYFTGLTALRSGLIPKLRSIQLLRRRQGRLNGRGGWVVTRWKTEFPGVQSMEVWRNKKSLGSSSCSNFVGSLAIPDSLI